ncbi:hypothetical protein COF80_27820, partial [Bacillus toyonensis]
MKFKAFFLAITIQKR